MRRFLVLGLGVIMALTVSFAACKKKEQQAVPQAPGVPPGMQMPPGGMPPGGGQMPPGHGGMGGPKTELKIVVPDSVKDKWSGVKLVLEDKGAKKSQEITVTLNSDYKVPNSTLKIAVGDFLPDFRMDGGQVTSASNDLNNPAVRVTVFEGDKEIFKGWLYSKFPAIHPFEHPTYGLTLKEGVKKG